MPYAPGLGGTPAGCSQLTREVSFFPCSWQPLFPRTAIICRHRRAMPLPPQRGYGPHPPGSACPAPASRKSSRGERNVSSAVVSLSHMQRRHSRFFVLRSPARRLSTHHARVRLERPLARLRRLSSCGPRRLAPTFGVQTAFCLQETPGDGHRTLAFLPPLR